ncbi:uncharacterized protein LOC107640039 [Arachis ipaensis]|uniref:uncharacterized protein LOC107640039 n=1 Tax=Arachis ipaensis TaxID=130454 RepID=UPI0007AF73AE|nr:uncharacterized protein LOC107640039 [Arachis ipaensis]
MEKYFKRTSSLEVGSQNNSSISSNKRRFLEFEVESLIAGPGQRPKISSYHPNDRDKVRCAYLQKDFFLRQGLVFRGNDETDDSVNQENFLELLNFLAQHSEEIDRAFKNACENLKLRASSFQKDIVRAVASEMTKVIINDLGDELFFVLIDEDRDISIKEQMSVCLSIGVIIRTYNLSLPRIHGQGYDGAACLNPRHLFFAFDNEKLIQLAQFYPLEFSSTQLLTLDSQLENFILDVRSDDQFSNLKGIGALSEKLVETRKNIVYPLVFLLSKLALVLPVATSNCIS